MARLLVVDDDPAIAKFVSRGLEAGGHIVSVTSNAPSAVRLARETEADVAIVDIVMPDIDGRTLLPLLLAVRPDLRVIMLSVDADVTTRVDCFAGGAADFVPKPFSIRELAARVQVQLRGSARPQDPHLIQVGGVALDRIRRSVQVRGRPIHLSNREFTLLHYLMSRSGRVCPREELMSEVWGFSFDPGTNIVDVCVRRLRQRIDIHLTGDDSFIETVRSAGYLVNGE